MAAWRPGLAYVHDQGYGFHATDLDSVVGRAAG